MFLRILLIVFWILALFPSPSAQTTRRQAQSPRKTTKPATESQNNGVRLRQNAPTGWVWVRQRIDLSKQFGGEENLYTLDGEPPPDMQRTRVSLGLVLDNEGHVITRLIDVTPNNPPLNVTVRADGARPVKAKFLGMDTVTGLCVLKVEENKETLKAANISANATLLPRLAIRLYGFHPNLTQGNSAVMSLDSPRRNFYPGQIVKAVNDFRYNSNNPIYYLLSPQLTPVQDCSLIFEKENVVFGLAIYDIGSEGKHLVYPISRVQAIAEKVIKSHQSIAYGWLGATGRDVYAPIQTATSKPQPVELGVRVTAVAPDSPAEQAGVKVQDVVVSINDRRVETYGQMATAMRQIPADSEINLRVKRGNEYKLLKAKLVPAPATDPEQQLFAFVRRLEAMKTELKALPASDPTRDRMESRVNMMSSFVTAVTSPAPPDIRLRVFYGIEIQSLTGQLMNYFAVTSGVLVTNVSEKSKAALAGLQAGDVIVKIAEQDITNLATLLKTLDGAPGETVEVTVSRRRESVKLSFLR